MKKRIVALIMAMAMPAMVFAGCGNSGKETASTSVESVAESSAVASSSAEDVPVIDDTGKEFKASDYVEIINYKDIELTKNEVYEITDDDVKSYIQDNKSAVEVEDADATVQDGDVVNIDYVGKLDGEEFDGGSAEGYDLTIGSGTFIDGFEEGLIGAKKGDTLTLHLTFPDQYTEELAGKDVDFDVTINTISRTDQTEPTDEELASARTELEEAYAEYDKQTYEEQIWTILTDSATYKAYPQSYIDFFAADYALTMIGADDEDSIEAYKEQYDMDDEAYDEAVGEYAISVTQNALVLEALKEQMNISEDSDEFKSIVSDLVEQTGEESEEALREDYGDLNVDLYAIQTIAFDQILAEAKYVESDTSSTSSVQQ